MERSAAVDNRIEAPGNSVPASMLSFHPDRWIAVLGGAARYTETPLSSAYAIGTEIARQGKNIITGATTGVPYAAALGAKREGAIVVGISPAASPEDHVEQFGKPLDVADFIVFTGMGWVPRSSPFPLGPALGLSSLEVSLERSTNSQLPGWSERIFWEC